MKVEKWKKQAGTGHALTIHLGQGGPAVSMEAGKCPPCVERVFR